MPARVGPGTAGAANGGEGAADEERGIKDEAAAGARELARNYLEKMPPLLRLAVLWSKASLLWRIIDCFRMLGFTFMYFMLKYAAPVAVFQASNNGKVEESVLNLLIGAACWGVVVLQAEEDVSRHVWWMAAVQSLRQQIQESAAASGGGIQQEMLEIKQRIMRWTSWEGLRLSGLALKILLLVGLLVETLSAVLFAVCTWELMRTSEGVTSKVTNCAALTIFIQIDDVLLGYLALEGPTRSPVVDKLNELGDTEDVAISYSNRCAYFLHVSWGVGVTILMVLYAAGVEEPAWRFAGLPAF